MKYKVSKEEHAALDDANKALYKATGEDFTLSVEGMPEIEDVAGLKKNLADLLGEKKAAKAAEEEATQKAAAIQAAADLAAANKSGDIDAINKSWQGKFDAQALRLEGITGQLHSATSGATATSIAASISIAGSQGILADAIGRRLKTEFDESGQAKTVVLGVDGKPSALTVEELTTEFKTNAAYAPLIVGSKAGGNGTNNAGGGAEGKVITRSQFDEMGAGDRSAYLKDGGTLTDAA